MILITGSTGTVGRNVVTQLVERGIEFRAMVHHMENASSISLPGVHIVPGNYDIPDTLTYAMQDMDSLFILSGGSPDQYRQETNLADAAVQTGIKHIVKLSVFGASPFSPISIEWKHWQCEKYIEETGIAFTFIRPNLFMQNILGQGNSIMSDSRLFGSTGHGRIPFIDARDIASVVVSVLTNAGHAGKIYEITGPESLSYYDIADRLSSVLGRDVKYIDLSPDDFRRSMLDREMPGWLIDDYMSYNQYFRDGYGSQTTSWNARLNDHSPIKFDQFIHDFLPVLEQMKKAA